MKFVLILFISLLLVDLVLAQRDPVCRTKPQVNGQCSEDNLGYTYVIDSGCEVYHAIGCVMGNFFHTREDCLAKCSPTWEYQLQDFYFRSMNVFGRLVTGLISAVRRFV